MVPRIPLEAKQSRRSRIARAARNRHAGRVVARTSETPSPTGPAFRVGQESRATRLVRALLARPAAWLLRVLASTWRVEIRGGDPFAPGAARPVLAALWHESALCAAGLYRDHGVHVAVSRSRDGEHIAAVLAKLGFGESMRGSSSRGGAEALRGVLRALDDGAVVAVLVDGPRGPAHVAKSGIVAAARLAGVPILPVGISARPCLRFASWDRMKLPLPFAHVCLRYDEPIAVASEASDADAEATRAALEARLEATPRVAAGSW
jgi:lysophospholipid acyltransferase (LPLAT)-like uncharacterized protein